MVQRLYELYNYLFICLYHIIFKLVLNKKTSGCYSVQVQKNLLNDFTNQMDEAKKGRPKNSNSDVWGSLAARVARSRILKDEMKLKAKCIDMDEETFSSFMMMDTAILESLYDLIPSLIKLKKRIDGFVVKGFIRDEPVMTKKEKLKQENSLCDDGLYSDLKEHVGSGRKAQKFKYEYEARGVFNRRLIKDCPDSFLKLTVVRKTLAKLYESIDIADFELKDKDVGNKDMNLHVSQREYDKMCVDLEQSESEQSESEQSDSYEKPSVASILEKADKESDSDSDEEYTARKALTPSIIEKRMKKCIDSYKSFKSQIKALDTNKDSLEIEEQLVILGVNASRCKSDYIKYQNLLKSKLEPPKATNHQDDKFIKSYLNDKVSRYKDDNTGEIVDLNVLADLNLYNGKTSKTMTKTKAKYSEDKKNKVRDELKSWLKPVPLGSKKKTKTDDSSDSEEFDFYSGKASKNTDQTIFQIMYEDNLSKDERKNEFKTVIKSLMRKESTFPFKKLTKACSDDMEMMLGMFESEYKSFTLASQTPRFM